MQPAPPDPAPATGRWQVEQVLALAPRPNSVTAAQPLAVPGKWVALGCDDRAVWGRCSGSGAEPYECTVDHVEVGVRCSCPSRVHPCKHALALLLLWARGQVPQGDRPRFAAGWLAGRAASPAAVAAAPAPAPAPAAAAPDPPQDGAGASAPAPPAPPPEPPTSSTRDERIARMMAGLAELDRWLDDRLRTGLADPALASYRTWDQLAARLVDAQVGGLANRVRRTAGVVGARSDWHEVLLAELGVLHLLATGGRHLGDLPPALADSVAGAVGWLVRQADVMAGVPTTDHWVVMGRSDVREDRIEVRRMWLRGRDTGEWAMVLSFAAYQQSLDTSLEVGTMVHADVFRYPGAAALRVLTGPRHAPPVAALDVRGRTVHQACADVGAVLALEPWLDRIPVCVQGAPARVGGRWVLTDAEGSLPLVDGASGIAALLACSAGRPVPVTAEWTPSGLVPLTAHLPDRAVDIGPVADASFVKAAS
ncbi:MAG: SWIM zinc finger family protein [Ilumatobacteraceae bacterium]